MKMLACVLVATISVPAVAATAAAQSADTQAAAAALTKRLGSTGPQSFAAQVPDSPSRFVAAMHIPGVQLLLITGNYQSPALLKELLMKGEHQRVYMDLNSAADREGRFFVEDLGADGLRPDREPNAAFDITWRDGTLRTLYNSSWKEQKLSEAEYRKRFEQDASDYARALRVLLDAHMKQTSR